MARRDLTGQILDGRYRVVGPIGTGAMGSVYRAEHLKLGRVVAVKVINEHVPSGMSARARFEREALAMAKLEHPHCASVLDVGLYEDMPYVVMEFISGQDLNELLKAGPVSIERAIEIMRQLLSGLAHAHEHGIVHRDIKPANVALSQKSGLGDHVKILDFGLARFNQETSNLTSGIVVGTPSYMAPEQILGRPVDQRTDLYACGVLLFELLTGTKPFQSANAEPVEVCMMHLNAPPPRLCDKVPGKDFGVLEEIVARALAKQPDQRFATANEFAKALGDVDGRRTAKTPPQPMQSALLETVPLAPLTNITTVKPMLADVAPGQPRKLRFQRLAIGLGAVLIVGTTIVVFVATRGPSKAPAPAPAAMPKASVDAATPQVSVEPDAVTDLVKRADELVSAGRRAAAIDLLLKGRKTYPSDARVPYHAGLLYLDQMWWADGLKQSRAALALDPNLKTDERLIKAVVRGFNTTAKYDWTLANFLRNDIGPAAKPYLEDVAREHSNPLTRKRAAAELQRY